MLRQKPLTSKPHCDSIAGFKIVGTSLEKWERLHFVVIVAAARKPNEPHVANIGITLNWACVLPRAFTPQPYLAGTAVPSISIFLLSHAKI